MFDVVCEVEAARRPDLAGVRGQVAALLAVTTRFVVPDNRLGRASVSSLAVAHEIRQAGATPLVCLNARDRNELGFRRDLLTAAAYGVHELVVLSGDGPRPGVTSAGVPAGGDPGRLTAAALLAAVRGAAADPAFAGQPPFRVGVATGPNPVPDWKRSADFVLAQIDFSVEAQLRWRDAADLDLPVYAGVMVLASAALGAALAATMPGVTVPAELLAAVAADPAAGVEYACQQVAALRESGAYEGVYLVPVSRYRDLATRLSASGNRPAGT